MVGVRSRLRLGLWILALSAVSLGCGRTAKSGTRLKPEPGEGGAPTALQPHEPAPNCAVAIAGRGGRHCAAYQDGSVWCWGVAGMAGPSNFEASAEPKQVEGLQGVQRLVLGPRHSCAQGSEGLLCWGDNESGQIDDSGKTPVAPTGPRLSGSLPSPLTGVGLSDTATCAVDALAHVYCRGTDASGRRSPQQQVPAGGERDTTIPGNGTQVIDEKGRIIDLADWKAPARLDFYGTDNAWYGAGTPVCVLKRWGSLWCGDYTFDTQDHALRAKLELGENVVQAGVGDLFLCALTQDGRVWCEGFNRVGQAGTGDDSVAAGGFVTGLQDVRALSVNGYSTCAVQGDGSVWCWGAYAQGLQSNVPTRVSGCTEQTTEPPERRGFVSAPRDRAQHLAEAARARAQAICACKNLAEPEPSCINGQDVSPNPTCLNALAQDQGQYWDCRAFSLWEEAACYTPRICAQTPGNLPPCPPPPTCDLSVVPTVEGYCRRRTCALDQEQPLTREQICDGVRDCTDSSDERNCEPGTPFFECAKGSVPLMRLCDGVPDCDDGSDEQYCQ